jgi:acetate kinase
MPVRRILTINAGSSSLKAAVYEAGTPSRRLMTTKVERVASDAADHARALETVLARAGAFDAVGHRIVHGGANYDASCLVTPALVADLNELSSLDPDHLPAEIAIVDALQRRGVPQVACFDTAFHRTMPRVAQIVAVPRRFEARGVRRYGFHGLSYAYLADALARAAGETAAHGRVVMAHLGSGASLVALREGKSVDTTMAFTPNSGIPMSTRSGDIDPGVLVHLMRTERLDADALDDLLSRRSGLLGVSETTADMRDLLARERSDARAADAVALFVHWARKAIGALATTIGGVETLVFSGGIGENAPVVRARIARGLEHLGIAIDDARNDANAPVISTNASRCSVRVIQTDEESIIARDTLRVLEGAP